MLLMQELKMDIYLLKIYRLKAKLDVKVIVIPKVNFQDIFP